MNQRDGLRQMEPSCIARMEITSMTDPNGWPERPGVPMNPEQDGYHWMAAVDRGVPTGHTAVMFWFAGAGFYAIEAVPVSHRNITEHWHYIGPCPTPAEVAARVEAAEQEAMDRGATRTIEMLASWLDVKEWEGGDGTETWDGDVSVEIGNVLAASDIYDSESGNVATHTLLREARREALREACANIAGLRDGSLVAVPRKPTEAIIDAMAEAHADAFACARASGALGLAPAQWLPLVWNAMLAATDQPT